ncbi:MAG: DUF2764 family protein [Kiritimatiellae bacterium]|jgi:hypothetical protein|nr:DUF2764 family protein [Kiritimatiellia bacterium]
MKYYFFAASLPRLSFSEGLPFEVEDFVELCDENLSPKDAQVVHALIDGVSESKSVKNPFLKKWNDSEIQLRNTIVKHRAAVRKCDPDQFLMRQEGSDYSIEKAVNDAYNKANPLEREKALDDFRWTQLECLGGMDLFDSNAIFAYALQLKILERWSKLDAEVGTERVQKIISEANVDE